MTKTVKKATKRGSMAKKKSKPSQMMKKKVARNMKSADKKNTTKKIKVLQQPKVRLFIYSSIRRVWTH